MLHMCCSAGAAHAGACLGGHACCLPTPGHAALQEVVRATNAVLCIASPRLVTYFVIGALEKRFLLTYIAACAACLCGLMVGDQIARRVSQRMFSWCLMAMLLASTLMLYASGIAGIMRGE